MKRKISSLWVALLAPGRRGAVARHARRIPQALFFGTALFLCAPTTGCAVGTDSASDGPSQTPATDPANSTAPSGGQGTGTVGFQLMLPGGDQINVINWQITGPNGAGTVVRSSSVTVPSAGTEFLVGNIPAGSGYQVTLSGRSTTGSVTCTGSATFSIAPHAQTTVPVQLDCYAAAPEAGPPDAGADAGKVDAGSDGGPPPPAPVPAMPPFDLALLAVAMLALGTAGHRRSGRATPRSVS
jgi:hypothetical protein